MRHEFTFRDPLAIVQSQHVSLRQVVLRGAIIYFGTGWNVPAL